MKFTVADTDGLGVKALIVAATEVYKYTGEHNIALGVIEGHTIGEDLAVAVVFAQRNDGKPGVMVTIEPNPRVIVASEGEPEAKAEPVEHASAGGGKHFYGIGRDCMCVGSCCNNAAGDCICPDCEDENHGHPDADAEDLCRAHSEPLSEHRCDG